MNNQPVKRSDPAIIFRYARYQIPGILIICLLYLLIYELTGFSFRLFLFILAGWILKDILFYPFVWKAYAVKHKSADDKLLGAEGVVRTSLNPTGYVQVNGELWKATSGNRDATLETGCKILVSGVSGLELTVVPASGAHAGGKHPYAK